MQVTAEQAFVSASRDRRARICRRDDGLFQVVTETLAAVTEECGAYWINDYHPSSLLAISAGAERHLRKLLPDAMDLRGLELCTFQLEVGPYPEPARQASA